MDTTACWRRIVQAIVENDQAEMDEAMRDLWDALIKGCAVPTASIEEMGFVSKVERDSYGEITITRQRTKIEASHGNLVIQFYPSSSIKEKGWSTVTPDRIELIGYNGAGIETLRFAFK